MKKTALFIVLLLASSSPGQQRALRPSKNYWSWIDDTPPKVHYVALANKRRLAVVGDSLYLLNDQNRIVWQWDSGGPPLNDVPFVDSHGTIYVIGMDLLWAAIDSRDGKEKWQGTANGRATYSQMVPYTRDMYFVVTDMGGYRTWSTSDLVVNDKLTLCRGNSVLWETEIPAGARLRVRGESVSVLVRRRNRRVSKRIVVPAKLEKPIGKISALADYN